MAVGNSVTPTIINQQIAGDAGYIKQQIYIWLRSRYASWDTSVGTAAQLTAVGITSTTDQALILGYINDLITVASVIDGTVPVVGTSGQPVYLALNTTVNQILGVY